MGQPYLGPDYALAQRITTLEKQLRALATGNPLENAQIGRGGILVNGSGGITLEGGGSMTVRNGGNVVVADSGSVEVAGSGQVTVDGLTLSAVRVGTDTKVATDFPLTTTPTTLATASVAVPAGFTQAVIMSDAAAGAFLSGSASDYLYLTGNINVFGTWGAAAVLCQGNAGTAPAAGTAYPSQSYSYHGLATGLHGGTITATVAVSTQANAWPAQTSNEAYINLTAFFLP